MEHKLEAADLAALEAIAPGRVFTGGQISEDYGHDELGDVAHMPEALVKVRSTEEVARILEYADRRLIPVVVRGSGTGLVGASVAVRGGIMLETTGMNRILELDEENLTVTVQPGVLLMDLAEFVESRGFFYPPDPGSQAVSTIGGNIAENAGGLRGLKYGVTKDYLMGLEFFDATGEIVKSGSRTVKCVTGYNLGGMLVQSEGTLGIISQAILKLVPPPKASKALMAVFDEVQNAAEAVAGIIAAHVVPCTLELLDNNTIVRVDDFTKAGLPREAGAILLIEVDGHPAQVADDAEAVERVLKANHASAVHVPKDAEEKFKLWEARRMALPVLARCRPTTVLEDATVPRSQIPAMLKAVNEIAAKYKLEVGTFGHAGDGNLHPTFLCDKRDKDEFHRVEEAIDEMFDVALKLHGTLSGEHGIGTAKAKWMEKETSRGTILFSQRLRRALDPKGLFNATKLVGI